MDRPSNNRIIVRCGKYLATQGFCWQWRQMNRAARFYKFCFFIFLFLFLGAFNSFSQDLSSWKYRQKIWINSSYSGANINETLNNFPLLVRLNGENFNFTQAQDSGQDVRFTAYNGEILNLEIERWDKNGGKAEIWVKVKQIAENSYNQFIYMYWGENSVDAVSIPENVFETNNQFFSVWHLNEDPGQNQVNTIKDRTTNNMDGDPVAFSPGALVDGPVGKAIQFNGNDTYIDFPGDFPQASEQRSLSVWAKSHIVESGRHVVGWGVASDYNSFGIMAYTGPNWWFFGWNVADINSGIAMDTEWHHHVATYDGGTVRYYLDGKLIKSESRALNTFGYNFKIGSRVDLVDKWNGIVDEVRVSSAPRSYGWIKMEYENQKPDSKILIFGEVENLEKEFFGNWNYQTLINLDTRISGANIGETQENFPVLIRLNSENFNFSLANPDGSDIRFVDLDENPLNFEMDSWDTLSQTGAFWVNIPQLVGNDQTEFLMLWGNSNASSKSSGSKVFNPENKFAGVWHLSEIGGTSQDNYKDASVNNFHGTGTGLGPEAAVTGNIGLAQDFSSTGQFIEILNSETGALNFKERDFFTLSAWVRPRYVNNVNKDIFNKGLRNYGLTMPDGTNWGVYDFINGQGWENIRSPSSNVDRWYHVVGVRDGGNLSLYVDGVKATNPFGILSNSASRNETSNLFLGNSPSNNAQWEGLLDEMRISRTARSESWIKLCFENQKANQTLVNFNALVQNSAPTLGFVNDNIIPNSQISQSTKGDGEITLNFKVKETNSVSVKLRSFSYSLNGGETWKVLEPSWGAFSGDWMNVEYTSSPQFSSSQLYSITFKSQNVPDFDGSHQTNVKFRFKATDGEISDFCETEAFSIDNFSPFVEINRYVTSNSQPQITGVSDEPLQFIWVTINDSIYPGTINQNNTWIVPAGTIAPLGSGEYDVYVQALDLFGNDNDYTRNRAIIVNEFATNITVDFLITKSTSPRISGTISDSSLSVKIQINNSSYNANYIGNNQWEVPEGVISPLSDGVYDIIATAGNGSRYGNDGTFNELVVDNSAPVIFFNNLITNISRTKIEGTSNEDLASIRIQIDSLIYDAQYTGNFQWSLDSGVIDSLKEGVNNIIIIAEDKAGNISMDSSKTITVDIDSPIPISYSPNKIKTTNLPLFQISFSEAIYPGTGSLTLVDISDNTANVDIDLNQIQGWGSQNLSFTAPDSLAQNTSYSVVIQKENFVDIAGNHLQESSLPLDWTFVTLDPLDAYITSITSNFPSNFYNTTYTLRLFLNFSEPVTLTGGNLNITLETGEDDAVISVSDISNLTQVSFDYTIRSGDFTEELNVKSIEVEGNDSLINGIGRKVVLSVGQNENLSASVKIGVDGLPLEVELLSPKSNDKVSDASISYTLNKKIARGSVTWMRVSPPTEGLFSPDTQTIQISSEYLTKGLHDKVNLSPLVEWGKVYNMEINLWDLADNKSQYQIVQVTIGQEVNAITLNSPSYEIKVRESIPITALNTIDGKPISTGINWSAIGPGAISNDGWLTSTALGYIKVIAQISSTKDTLIVKVREGDFRVPEGGNDSLQISDFFQLRIPAAGGLASGVIKAFVMDSALYSGHFSTLGAGINFDSTKIDGLVLAVPVPGNMPGVSIYQLEDANSMSWKKLPTVQNGNWMEYTLQGESLGAYIVGYDLVKPYVALSIPDTLVMGINSYIQYSVNDNITNPLVTLQIFNGGSRAFFSDTLSIEKIQYDLPGNFVSLNGFYGYIEVFDGSNLVKSDTISPLVLNAASVRNPNLKETSHYKMFSFPMKHAVSNVNELIMNEWGDVDRTKWRLYEYDSGFVEIGKNNIIEPGQAYWYKTQNFEPAIVFNPLKAAAFPITSMFKRKLHFGWNSFSNPYLFPITLADIQRYNGGYPNIVYSYDSTWVPLGPADSIKPWEGYILWNGNKGELFIDELNINPVDLAAPSAKLSDNYLPAGIDIWVQANYSKAGVITAHPSKRGILDYEVLLPERPGKNLDLFFISKEGKALIRQSKSLEEKGNQWDLKVMSQNVIHSFELNLNSMYAISEGLKAIILNSGDAKSYELKNGNNKIKLRSREKTAQLKLAMGTEEYLREITDSFFKENLKLSLSQNYPNPFIHSTTINFTLPYSNQGQEFVSLKIYDLKGREVFNKSIGQYGMGNHNYVLNMKDANLNKLPAGNYFLQLNFGQQKTKSKKLIYLGSF